MVRKTDRRKSIKVITLNSFITAYCASDLSLKARKLLLLAIGQCRKSDREFYEYELTVSEFAEQMNIHKSNVYREAEKITDELLSVRVRVQFPGERSYTKLTVFSFCRYTDNKTIRFKLNPDMTRTLLDLRGDFTQPLLSDFMLMRSNFTISLWHLMQREMKSRKPGITDLIEFDLDLWEMRQVTNTIDKFTRLSDFRIRVLDHAVREIKEICFVEMTYTSIKQGHTVTGFHFSCRHPMHLDIGSIPETDRERVELFDLKQKIKTIELSGEEMKRYSELSLKLAGVKR